MGRSIVVAVAATVLAGVLASAPAYADRGAAPDPGASPGPAASPAPGEIPEQSIDLHFAITLQSLSCGHDNLAPAAPRVHPEKGQFCLAKLTFTNITTSTVWFSLSTWLQRAYTSDGVGRWGDMRASEAVNRANPFMKRVPANAAVSGTVVFDIPKSVTITRLHIRESILSGGIDIKP
jgi:hypothetical protein